MNGKELLISALKSNPTPRTPWVPFVGVHGAFMLGKNATEYLKSADLIVEAMVKAKELYKPDGLPIVFDLQLEAEILGCDLHWSEDGPPSVSSHPLEGDDGIDLSKLPKFDINSGRFPLVMDATKRISEIMGAEVALYGLICGPFTLALHLLGNDIFLEMFDDEDGVKDLMGYCTDVCKQVSEAYIKNGCDVIAVVDPMLSQISPDHVQEFVTPALNDIFDYIHSMKKLGSVFVCGDVTRNNEVLCATHCDNISVDENVDLESLIAIAKEHGTSVGGNMKLTLALLLGSETDCKIDALRCIDAGNNTGFILAPGCDLPFETPIANLVASGAMATDEYAREAARSLQASETEDFSDILLPDYSGEKQVILDLITLDSLSCAPCQYMVDAAQRAVKAAGVDAVVREYKVKARDGIGMMTKLGVTNIPTICIDGQQAFVSNIPDLPSLIAKIQEAYNAKNND